MYYIVKNKYNIVVTVIISDRLFILANMIINRNSNLYSVKCKVKSSIVVLYEWICNTKRKEQNFVRQEI